MRAVTLQDIAEHMRARREGLLEAWRRAVSRDAQLSSAKALPWRQLYDHVPQLLQTFEHELRSAEQAPQDTAAAAHEPAAAHGLQRWQLGFNLREVSRELGRLNQCVVEELDSFGIRHQTDASIAALCEARRRWAVICGATIEESVAQYFLRQQEEAAAHVTQLQGALKALRGLEEQRAVLWQEAAHDLRGNVGVFTQATLGLTRPDIKHSSRETFERILKSSLSTLRQLLDDITSLARLQAGQEQLQVAELDLTPLLEHLCEEARPLAQERRLYLYAQGPKSLTVAGDAVKIRRIAQNLLLNALKYTRTGGVTVSWADGAPKDPERWMMSIADTGSGIKQARSTALAGGQTTEIAKSNDLTEPTEPGGEGLGLSIVKRLCDLLNATVEVDSLQGSGTTFRVFFPRRYDA